MKTACASSLRQNSHCSETTFSTPVTGIAAVDAERSSVLVANAEFDGAPVGKIVPTAGGVATGKLQLEVNTINNAPSKTARETTFIPYLCHSS
jgi:hypothetical protein